MAGAAVFHLPTAAACGVPGGAGASTGALKELNFVVRGWVCMCAYPRIS